VSRRRAHDDRNMSLFAPEPEPVEPHTLPAPTPDLERLYDIGNRSEGIRLKIRAAGIAGEPVDPELHRQMDELYADWKREIDLATKRDPTCMSTYWRARMARQKEMSCEFE
jgi:hypothetical protein